MDEMDETNSRDVSWAVPAMAAILAALIAILGTILIQGVTDKSQSMNNYMPLAVHQEFEKRMSEWHESEEKAITDLNSRISRLEGAASTQDGRNRARSFEMNR